MDRQTVVTSDDHKLGTVVEERDNCVIIETGHVFKTKHAIPREFLHDVDGLEWANANLVGEVTLAFDEQRITRDQLVERLGKAGFHELSGTAAE